MKNKLIITFLLLILCAGSVTAAVKSFDDVNNRLLEAKNIETEKIEATKMTPTPTPEPAVEEETPAETPTPEPVDPSLLIR